MSKTIYYIGAGASYGKRDRTKGIIEGIPIVAEIPIQIAMFRDYIAKAEIPVSGYTPFQGKYQRANSDIERSRQELLSDIDGMMTGIKEHATIDTFARKLFLTGQKRQFNRLKDVLCAFFVWAQLIYKPDGRYDAFFANVLQEGTLALPEELSIISWNYDSQLETAYKVYNRTGYLPVFEKNIRGTWPDLPLSGRVFKINGSATFVDKPVVEIIKEDEKMTVPMQLIEFYHNAHVDTSDLGVDFTTHLSFAWEDSNNKENMHAALKETTSDTEIVVVIGYSFPFFNRVTDRQLFGGMPSLRRVYVQDINPEAVVQSIQGVLPVGRKIEVIPIRECSQFYLPSEL